MINTYNFSQSDILIEGKSLTCHRSARLVFAGLDFTMKSGMAMMVQGANGAGKTTLLRVIAGLLPLSGGSLKRPETASLYHYLGHQNALKKQKTAEDSGIPTLSVYLGSQKTRCRTTRGSRSYISGTTHQELSIVCVNCE